VNLISIFHFFQKWKIEGRHARVEQRQALCRRRGTCIWGLRHVGSRINSVHVHVHCSLYIYDCVNVRVLTLYILYTSCLHIQEAGRREETVCGGGSERVRRVFTSTTHELRVTIVQQDDVTQRDDKPGGDMERRDGRQGDARFVLKYEGRYV